MPARSRMTISISEFAVIARDEGVVEDARAGSWVETDAVNLYQACEVAKTNIPEVAGSLESYVYRSVRAQKKDDRHFEAFESPSYPPLAELTSGVHVGRELLPVI